MAESSPGTRGRGETSSRQDRFGPLALQLEARLCGRGDFARLVYRASDLDEPTRVMIREWAREHGELDHTGSSWITPDVEALRRGAKSSEVAATLLAAWDSARAAVPAPELMGILNVTPDSFSERGLNFEAGRAIEAGLRMAAEGASWIDVGGESTRPGAEPVPLAEELRRVVPVIEALKREGGARISIDTRHAAVAAAALEAGAEMVNDVGAGLDDDDMLAVVRDAGCPWVLMHRQGRPESMQVDPRYDDAVAEIVAFLRRRVAECLEAGIEESQLWVDPGIGFGKTLEHNLDLLRRLSELRSLGLPLLLGPSRKSFIGHATGNEERSDWRRTQATDDPSRRIGGTAAAITFCVLGGAKVLRVHDVAVMAEAAQIASAIHARPPLPAPLPC